jgi:hypothetical protein
MPSCFACTAGVPHGGIGIGVCSKCSAIACPSHGNKVHGTPRFKCSDCWQNLVVLSAVKPHGPGGGGGGGLPGGGPGGGPDDDAPFSGSTDFEAKLPEIARASRPYRHAIEPRAVREAIRGLFRLVNLADERERFTDQVVDYVRPAVTDLVRRQVTERTRMREEFEARDGESMMVDSYLGQVAGDVRSWLDHGLADWMVSLRPDLDEGSWLGYQQSVDVPLLADAVGLARYTWGLEDNESPFQRLHLARTAAPETLVLTELCGLPMPMRAFA